MRFGSLLSETQVQNILAMTPRTIDPNKYTGSDGTACVIPTPDPVSADGEVIHPAVVYSPEKWNDYYYWMAFTPYYDNDDQYEDPCIVASNDGVNWEVPAGLTNPLDNKPGGTQYNSDTHLTFGPDGNLYVFWRYLDTTATGEEEKIYYSTSSDGVTWAAAQLVYQSDLTVRRLLSPSFTYYDGAWHLWAVDIVGTKRLVYATSSSLTGTWPTPMDCTLSLPSGRYIWHVYVDRVGDQWVGLLNDTSNSGSSGQNGDIILMTSDDATTWTLADQPCVSRAGDDFTVQYRSCFVAKVVDGVWGFDLWHAVRFPNKIYRSSLTLLDYRPDSDATFGKLGLGSIAPDTRPLRLSGSAPEMEFVETDNGDKTYHIGVNSGAFKFSETGVLDRLIIQPADQNYGLRYLGTDAKSSGNHESFLIAPTNNQTGTANYVGLQVYVTDNSTSTGNNYPMRVQVNGTDKFRVGSDGFIKAGNGLVLYNTADETTNTEDLRILWDSNIAKIIVDADGTGTTRALWLQANDASTGVVQLKMFRDGPNFVEATHSSTSATRSALAVSGTSTSSSAAYTSLSVSPTISQSGTGSYTALLINPTESSTGSGNKYLIDAQVGGVSKFKVYNTGVITHPGTFAEIYVQGASASQTTNASAGTFDQLTAFTTNGQSSDCTADAANDRITTTRAGKYKVNFSASFSGDPVDTYQLELYNSTTSTEYTNCFTERALGAGGDIGSVSFTGVISTAANDNIIVRVACTTSGSALITIKHANLILERIGN